ncbi:hypothetical protein BKA70DRAFT_1306214 [Coprinopsis sp. MPI-PUGE-AT-0042]|nr:hypothetical protein BKA70DRAFT_1306214 [Coprinopsis sp. MPI-PUGE-AT-0042]
MGIVAQPPSVVNFNQHPALTMKTTAIIAYLAVALATVHAAPLPQLLSGLPNSLGGALNGIPVVGPLLSDLLGGVRGGRPL